MIKLDVDRSAKILFDSGMATSFEEAEKRLATLTLVVDVDKGAARTKKGQTAFLTAVNCGLRCFKGGVFVRGNLDEPLQVRWRHDCTLREAADQLGARMSEAPTDSIAVLIGNQPCEEKISVRAFAGGFAGGAVPSDFETIIDDSPFTPSGVLAGALCVSEAFSRRTSSKVACERKVGCDLMQPGTPWLKSFDDGSVSCISPDLWVVGLGHLGQAYLWTTSFLAPPKNKKSLILLQDYDVYTKENSATSLLGADHAIGLKKTRLCAAWLEKRFFATSIVERKFDRSVSINTTPPPSEPVIALIGVDNMPTRREISKTDGFELIVDVGLGGTPDDYTGFALHTFPGPIESTTAFPARRSTEGAPPPALLETPNYKTLKVEDDCGTLRLANIAVGASFVGAAAAALAISQTLKYLSGKRNEALIDGDLRHMRYLTSVPNDPLFSRSPYRVNRNDRAQQP